MFLRFLAIVLFLSLSSLMPTAAQTPFQNLPVRNIGGVECRVYKVQPKDNIYSVSALLGIDRSEIIRLNPSVADGLKEGDELVFPVNEHPAVRTHVVKGKETIYSIARQYGLTISELQAWNPSTIDGIVVGQVLYVSEPAAASPQMPAADTSALATHTIAQGESLYRISINYGTTVDAILAVNPGLERDHYKAGQVIFIPADAEAVKAEKRPEESPLLDLTENPQPAVAPLTHTVQNGETFYSIAHDYGLTVEQLEKANPEVGIIKPGMTLVIPAEGKAPVDAVAAATVEDGEEEEDPTAGGEEFAEAFTPGSVDIALTLPLMLDSPEQPRQAQLYTEFYKGFLVAVDSLRRCGTPINIQVYDTKGSDDTLRSILTNPVLESASVIIAPDSESQLDILGDYGRERGIDVLNLFVVKDNSYLTNPAMMQGNIPHAQMYSKSISGIIDRLGEFTPVIVKRAGAPDDKGEYIAALKSSFEERGVPYRVLTFEGNLKESDLDSLDMSVPYAFIPASGKQAELNRVLPALIGFKTRSLLPDPVRVYGYPEWMTFRGETLQNMHKVNTFVYTRFYIVPDDPAVKAVEDAYIRWYGSPMANFVPRQGLFGFDTGMFLIKALADGASDRNPTSYGKWVGAQNGFDFRRTPGGGLVNNELYFINYRPSGLIDKIQL